jgi:hypothetical protein
VEWHLAAYDGQKAVILAATHVDGDGQASLIAIEHGANGWSPPSPVADGIANLSKPRVAYRADGTPAAAWSGDAGVQGAVGDLKARPTTWFTDAFTLEALAIDEDGLALTLSGSLAEEGSGLLQARYDEGRASWGAPRQVMGRWASSSGLSVVPANGGETVLLLAEPVARKESRDVGNGQVVEIDGVPELANIRLVRAPAISQAAEATAAPTPASSAANPGGAGGDPTLWLVGGGVAAVLLVLGGVLVLRRRS